MSDGWQAFCGIVVGVFIVHCVLVGIGWVIWRFLKAYPWRKHP